MKVLNETGDDPQMGDILGLDLDMAPVRMLLAGACNGHDGNNTTKDCRENCEVLCDAHFRSIVL